MYDLRSKVAIITGYSKGIGAACVSKLATHGAAVVVNLREDESAAGRPVRAIRDAGGVTLAINADVTKSEGVVTLLEGAVREFGRVDVVVNNTGGFERVPLADSTEEHFYHLVDLNLLSVIICCHQAAATSGAEGGVINNGGSISSATCPVDSTVYNATKAAVDAVTVTLAKELVMGQFEI